MVVQLEKYNVYMCIGHITDLNLLARGCYARLGIQEAVGSNPVGALDWKFLFTDLFLILLQEHGHFAADLQFIIFIVCTRSVEAGNFS